MATAGWWTPLPGRSLIGRKVVRQRFFWEMCALPPACAMRPVSGPPAPSCPARWPAPFWTRDSAGAAAPLCSSPRRLVWCLLLGAYFTLCFFVFFFLVLVDALAK